MRRAALPFLVLLAAAGAADITDDPDPPPPPAVSLAGDPFWTAAAGELGLSPSRFEGPVNRGFGRSELILMAMIARDSGAEWTGLLARRAGGETLRAMAASAGLNYNDLFREAEAIRRWAAEAAADPGTETDKAGSP